MKFIGIGIGLDLGSNGKGPVEVGPSWLELFTEGSLEDLEAWYIENTGPRVALTTVLEGDQTIVTQADADELVGAHITGRVLFANGVTPIEARDFQCDWLDTNTGLAAGQLINFTNGASNVHLHHVKVDGMDGLTTSGIYGTSYSTGILVEYCDISRCGNDAIRPHKNSEYYYNYVHDMRVWNEGTDGVYDPEGSQEEFPHSDVVQNLRSGNTIRFNWLAQNIGSSVTSGLIVISDTDETINGFTFDQNVLDGGAHNIHLHAAGTLADPGVWGPPMNLIITNNRIGRNNRVGEVNSTIPSDNFTFTGNVYADDFEAFPAPAIIAYPYAAETDALIARMTSGAPTTDRGKFIDTLIRNLKNRGIWSALDALYVMAAHNAPAARLNWKQDAFNLAAVSTPQFTTDRGYNGNGTSSHLTTGFVPSTAGGQMTLNSAHMSLWVRNEINSSAQVPMGARTTSTTNQMLLLPRSGTNTAIFRLNQDASGLAPASASSIGHWLARRNGAATSALFKNGVSVQADTAASTGLPTFGILLGAINTAGAAASFAQHQMAAASFGASLTDQQAADMYAAVQAFLRNIGAA